MVKHLKPLFEILKIKSISTQDEYRPEMQKAREFLVKSFKEMGFETKVLKAQRHDAVFAQRIVDESAYTVLIYGHYDVQPPEPIDEWASDPFNPTIKNDVHSGQFGGVAPNPAIELARIIFKLKDENGKILIPEFYKNVMDPTKEELADFKNLKVSGKMLMKEGGMFFVDGGEKEYSLNERRWSRPTLDVNGITSGYQGEGSKTIIPKTASAKISMRLVPNQDPEEIFKLFEKFVKRLAPKGMKLKIAYHSGALPYKAPTKNPIFTLMKESLKKIYKKDAVFSGVGGSIGFVPTMANALKIPCVMVGFGLPDENLHAPNEHFSIKNYLRGIETMVDFYQKLVK